MTDQTTKSWLQRLKDESWEAELLVSVASIFAIFNAFDFLDWAVNFFIDQLPPSQYFIGYMICFCGYLAFGILGSFFVIHFGLRAYWIGIVGLNSVFPDYSIEDSPYSKTYSQKMAEKLPKLTDTIDRLDEICSVIFSAAFTLLLTYAYIGIISSLYILVYNFLSGLMPSILLLAPVLLLGILYVVILVIMILANFKNNKNKVTLQTWYYKSIIISSKVFFGPLYKYLLQVNMIFGTNFKKKKSLVRAIIMMLVLGFAFGGFQIFQSNVIYLLRKDRSLDTTRVYPEFYQANNEGSDLLLAPEINDFTIDSNHAILFIPLFNHETRILERFCDELKENPNPTKQEKWLANLNCYSDALQVKLNDEILECDFLKTDHPQTNQFGLQTIIDNKLLAKGKNTLFIKKDIDEVIQKEWQIVFYRR